MIDSKRSTHLSHIYANGVTHLIYNPNRERAKIRTFLCMTLLFSLDHLLGASCDTTVNVSSTSTHTVSKFNFCSRISFSRSSKLPPIVQIITRESARKAKNSTRTRARSPSWKKNNAYNTHISLCHHHHHSMPRAQSN